LYVGTGDGKVLVFQQDHDAVFYTADTGRNQAVRELSVSKDNKTLVAGSEGTAVVFKLGMKN
jgi:hypothetical protein